MLPPSMPSIFPRLPSIISCFGSGLSLFFLFILIVAFPKSDQNTEYHYFVHTTTRTISKMARQYGTIRNESPPFSEDNGGVTRPHTEFGPGYYEYMKYINRPHNIPGAVPAFADANPRNATQARRHRSMAKGLLYAVAILAVGSCIWFTRWMMCEDSKATAHKAGKRLLASCYPFPVHHTALPSPILETLPVGLLFCIHAPRFSNLDHEHPISRWYQSLTRTAYAFVLHQKRVVRIESHGVDPTETSRKFSPLFHPRAEVGFREAFGLHVLALSKARVHPRDLQDSATVENADNDLGAEDPMIIAAMHKPANSNNATVIEAIATAVNSGDALAVKHAANIMPSTFVSVVIPVTKPARYHIHGTPSPKSKTKPKKPGKVFGFEQHFKSTEHRPDLDLESRSNAAMAEADNIKWSIYSEEGSESDREGSDGGPGHEGCHAYLCRKKIHEDWKDGYDDEGNFHGVWNDWHPDKWYCYPGGCGDLPDCDPKYCDVEPGKFNDFTGGEHSCFGSKMGKPKKEEDSSSLDSDSD